MILPLLAFVPWKIIFQVNGTRPSIQESVEGLKDLKKKKATAASWEGDINKEFKKKITETKKNNK